MKRRTKRRVLVWIVVAAALLTLVGRRTATAVRARRAASVAARDPSLVRVTGYCNCEKCCGWRRSWFGFGEPVYAYGTMKGKPKRVGVTASGTVAHKGTVAADPKIWKFGTRLRIPGFGTGTVEDVGGAIKGRHIDLWFPSHAEAKAWGSKWLKVEEIRTVPRVDCR